MSQQDDNELDKAFRSGINKMRLVPPPVVWDGVRAAALQQQLFHIQTINSWLKILSACLGIALVGSVFYYENKKTTPLPTENNVAQQPTIITKTDTVYITKTEKEFVPIYEHNTNSNEVRKEDSYLSQNIDNQALVNNNTPSKSSQFDKRYSMNNTISESKSMANSSPEKSKGNLQTQLNQNSEQGIETAEISNKNQNSISSDEGVMSGLKTENDATHRIEFAKESLDSKEFSETKFKEKLPEIEFSHRPIRNANVLQQRVFDWTKLSVESYASKDINTLIVKTETSVGQILKEQNLKNEFSYGIRLALDVAPQLTIMTGFESTSSTFSESGKIEELTPEFHRNAPDFPHSTPLGTGFIPNDNSGDKFMLKAGEHKVSMLRIPVLAKYYFYETRMSVLKSNYHDLRFYILGGGYWNFSLKQELSAEVLTPNGQKKAMTLTNFQGVEKNIYGINVGIGAEYNFMKNWSFYLEPSYKSSITPIVNDAPQKTNIVGYSLNGGLKFRFGK